PYAVPAPDIAAVADAPPIPAVHLAPGGGFAVLVHSQAHPPVAMLARPYLALAGLRIDPVLGARRRLRRVNAVSVLRITDGKERFLDLPEDAQVGSLAWAPDGRRFAFPVDRPDGVGLWLGDAVAGEAREVAGVTLCDVLAGEASVDGGTVRWARDGRSLLLLR